MSFRRSLGEGFIQKTNWIQGPAVLVQQPVHQNVVCWLQSHVLSFPSFVLRMHLFQFFGLPFGHLIYSFSHYNFGYDVEFIFAAPTSLWNYSPTFQMTFQISSPGWLKLPQTEYFPLQSLLLFFSQTNAYSPSCSVFNDIYDFLAAEAEHLRISIFCYLPVCFYIQWSNLISSYSLTFTLVPSLLIISIPLT